MGNDEQLELFDELHRRSALLPELDAPRIEGFVSGFFAVWDTVDDEIRRAAAHLDSMLSGRSIGDTSTVPTLGEARVDEKIGRAHV